MGQATSTGEELNIHPMQKLQAHLDVLSTVATLTYPEFLRSIDEINNITSTFCDSRGKQLRFIVKKGTDTTFLWKVTVRIRCYKVNAQTQRVDSCRALTLRQYAVIYREIVEQLGSLSTLQHSCPEDISSSAIFNEFTSGGTVVDEENECCICMERKAEVILACGHNFCEICIDSWTSERRQSNCPLCRKKVRGADDTWILTEKPDSTDYETEVKGYLVGLVDRTGEPLT